MITLLRCLNFTEHLFLYWEIKLEVEKNKKGEKQLDNQSLIIFL